MALTLAGPAQAVAAENGLGGSAVCPLAVRPAVLESHLPSGLALDTFDGRAWLGIAPFRISGIRSRCLPAIPGLTDFPELNLRTYVVADGKPGVWFFSLDAASRAARAAPAGSITFPTTTPGSPVRSCRMAGSIIDVAAETANIRPPSSSLDIVR